MGLPGKYFTAPRVFMRARENIFFRTWQYACHQSQVPDAGDCFGFSLFDQDVLVVRGGDGVLRGFYNVCRHRGHKLVAVDGVGKIRGKAMRCPYHAWCYGLDGRLRAAPNAQNVPGFNGDHIRLAAVAVEEFLGFVLVNLDLEAQPVDECYPGVREAALKLCPKILQLRFAHAHSADEQCNWLIAVENYNECYHCPTAHRDFAEGIIDPDSYDIAPFGDGYCLRHASRATRSGRAWYDVSGSDYGSFYLWPAFALQVYPGGVVNTYHWRPQAIDRTRVHRGWFSAHGEVDAGLQKIIDLDRETTFAEDLKLVKNVQRGVQSRGFAPGPLMIAPGGGIGNELSVATLHRWLREAVDAGTGKAGQAGKVGKVGKTGQVGQARQAGQAEKVGKALKAGKAGQAGKAEKTGKVGQAGKVGKAGKTRKAGGY